MRKSATGFALIVSAGILSAGVLAAGCQSGVSVPVAPSPGIRSASGEALGAAVPAPNSGPGINAPGIWLTVTPRVDGDLDVTEQVLLREPTTTLRLRPPSAGSTSPALARSKPAAVEVEVVADGHIVPLEPDQVRGARDLSLTTEVSRLEISYRLIGATVRSMPSSARRALAVVAPLVAPTDGTLPTGVVLDGPGLRNANCPRLPEPRCATGEYPRMGIRREIPAELATAVMQLDLPGPVAR
jgi:hypothetical protein